MNYKEATALYSRKRGKCRSLGSYDYMHKEGDNFVIYTGDPSKSKYAQKDITIHPDDTFEFHWRNNGQGFAIKLEKYTPFFLHRVGKDTVKHNYEVRGFGVSTPMFNGLKIRGSEVLNPQPKQHRILVPEKRKPVLDKLAHWKKVFDVVYLMRKPDIEEGCGWEKRLPADFKWPTFEQEVDANMAFALLRDASARTEITESYQTGETETISYANGATYTYPKWARRERPNYYKNLLKNATEKLRERWYEETGAYQWVDTINEAA